MKKLILTGLILIATHVANAAGHDHTESFCSAQNQSICLHLGFHGGLPTVNAETAFMTHFTTDASVDVNLIQNVEVKLWMPDMGHGSYPVVVKQLDAVHYQVTEAYFIMSGLWQVIVNFKYDGTAQQIIVPITIE